MCVRRFQRTIVAIGIAIAAFAAFATGTAAANAPAARPDSDALIQRIASTIRTYTPFSIFDDISVSVDRRDVTLDGRVTMAFKREEIEARVRRIDGVERVTNRITVLPVSRSDSDLRQRLALAIYGNSAFRHYASMLSPPIHIVVEYGRVTLTGTVNSEVERRLAESLAYVPGAFSITNQLKLDTDR